MESAKALSRFTLRPLERKDLLAVVQLHQAAFPDSLNSLLGAPHLTLLYDEMLRDAGSVVIVAVNDAGPVGVVSGTLDPKEFKKRFKAQLSFQQKLGLAGRMLLNPFGLRDFLRETVLEKPVFFHDRMVKACLTAIAVELSCRQSGIGRGLVNAVEEFFRQKGETAFYLFTRANNTVSGEFYRKLGFVELEQRGRDIVLLKELK